MVKYGKEFKNRGRIETEEGTLWISYDPLKG
jgi:hypothetical protein